MVSCFFGRSVMTVHPRPLRVGRSPEKQRKTLLNVQGGVAQRYFEKLVS
jgi:hypothetical protein